MTDLIRLYVPSLPSPPPPPPKPPPPPPPPKPKPKPPKKNNDDDDDDGEAEYWMSVYLTCMANADTSSDSRKRDAHIQCEARADAAVGN